MASFSSEPGLVWCGHATSAQPCPEPVAGPSWPRTSPSVRRPPSSLTSSSPKRRNLATSSPITGASPLRVGAPAPPNRTAAHLRSPAPTGEPAAGAAARPSEPAPAPAPYGHDGDASPSWHTTHPGSPPPHPAGPLITHRDRLGRCLSLAHRQSHHRDLPVAPQ